MDFNYGQVEAALATACEVTPKAIGAFRARLRHLRNLGLPRLPKPGSGKHISYTERQALEMMMAVLLENHGYAARKAMLVAQSIVRQSPPYYGQHRGGDCFVLIDRPDSPSYVVALGHRALAKALKSRSALFLVINVSTYARKLDDALDRAPATG